MIRLPGVSDGSVTKVSSRFRSWKYTSMLDRVWPIISAAGNVWACSRGSCYCSLSVHCGAVIHASHPAGLKWHILPTHGGKCTVNITHKRGEDRISPEKNSLNRNLRSSSVIDAGRSLARTNQTRPTLLLLFCYIRSSCFWLYHSIIYDPLPPDSLFVEVSVHRSNTNIS